jgi:DNA-binding beta-propeller fold protein YncE
MSIQTKQAIVASASLVLVACSGGSPDPSAHAESVSVSTEAIHRSLGSLGGPVLPRLSPNLMTSGSTVPDNGDLNPYGVAFVPFGFPRGGILRPGDVIVSNFNNGLTTQGGNLQGTGTTIVRVNPNASPSLFYSNSNPEARGFSTALGALSAGLVIVGNLPSTDASGTCTEGADGQEENVGQGLLQVIDRNGRLVQTLADAKLLNGPWDLTVDDDGDRALVFVSNALSGSVTRLNLRVGPGGVDVVSMTSIASGYVHKCDLAAFVQAPTGLALDEVRDVLYVASTGNNAIYAIDDASTTERDHGIGRVVVNDSTHLHGPLGLVRAPNGDLISSQGDAVNPDPTQPSEIVEFSPRGQFIAEFPIDPTPGSAFGLALVSVGPFLRFAAVDDALNADNQNVLDEWLVLPR